MVGLTQWPAYCTHGKDYRIGTLHYNWPMSAHVSQASAHTLQHLTAPIRNIYPPIIPHSQFFL